MLIVGYIITFKKLLLYLQCVGLYLLKLELIRGLRYRKLCRSQPPCMAFAFLSPHEEVWYVLERKDIIMDNIQIFKNESFGEVRVAGTSEVNLISTSNFLGREINVYGSVENPLFLANDVAEWIEHSNVTEMIRGIDDDEKLTSTILRAGQRRDCNLLTEDGLYEVLMQSRKPIAKDFKKGIKGILKTIRKHGIYATDNVIDQILNNPDFGIELLTKLKEERSARIEAEKQVAVLTHVNKTYTCTEVAKELGLKSAIELNNRLKELGVQYKVNQTWVPYTKYSTLGWFDIKQEVADNGHIIYHRKITGIGRQGIINLINS